MHFIHLLFTAYMESNSEDSDSDNSDCDALDSDLEAESKQTYERIGVGWFRNHFYGIYTYIGIYSLLLIHNT